MSRAPPRPKMVKTNMWSPVIHTNIEPGVIDNDMIYRCVVNFGPTGEAGRLFAEEGVDIEKVPIVRLEFQNIMRLDHLWMLKSVTILSLCHNNIEKIENLHQLTLLKELDLSFNKIEVIENLEELRKIEVLSLFHNKIRKLQNLDALENLLVFSIGDNNIEDMREMTYLRRFRFLRSASVKGNPCCGEPNFYVFMKAALVNVAYLDYKVIHDEDRRRGRDYYWSQLREMDEIDAAREKARIAKAAYDAKVEFYALSFVEYLSGPEMVETMFEKDPDGSLLLTLGGDLDTNYRQYKEEYVETMDKLVDYAQNAYNDRQKEINLIKDLMNNALDESVDNSKAAVSLFVERKKGLVDDMKIIIEEFLSKEKNSSLDLIEPKVVDLTELFNEALYALWKELMQIEMRLFEQCEECRIQFGVNMTEKITKLLEQSRAAFGMWRELDGVWQSRLIEALSKLMSNRALVGSVCDELQEILDDRDTMMNAVATSSDLHMRFIDAREDVLLTRANDWKDETLTSCNEDEIRRNRSRILEINYYIDNQRQEWTDMQMLLTDNVDPETAALLGDDF